MISEPIILASLDAAVARNGGPFLAPFSAGGDGRTMAQIARNEIFSMVDAFKSGASISKIAESHNRGVATVKRVLDGAHSGWRDRYKLTARDLPTKSMQSIITMRPFVEVVPEGMKFEEVLRAGADAFGIPVIDIVSNRRSNEIAHLRFAIAFVGRMVTLRSYPEMGRLLKRDHTSVWHGVQCVTTTPSRYAPIVNRIFDHLGLPNMTCDDIAKALHRPITERVAA